MMRVAPGALRQIDLATEVRMIPIVVSPSVVISGNKKRPTGMVRRSASTGVGDVLGEGFWGAETLGSFYLFSQFRGLVASGVAGDQHDVSEVREADLACSGEASQHTARRVCRTGLDLGRRLVVSRRPETLARSPRECHPVTHSTCGRFAECAQSQKRW